MGAPPTDQQMAGVAGGLKMVGQQLQQLKTDHDELESDFKDLQDKVKDLEKKMDAMEKKSAKK